MRKRNIYLFVGFAILTVVGWIDQAMGQENNSSGTLSGSLETNGIWYSRPDSPPVDRFGSNNYLKLDYTNSDLVIGLQYELYTPALAGFNPNLQGSTFQVYCL